MEQKVVDEIVAAEINNEIFQLRILEDSYGPMRIMVTQNSSRDGRDNESSCSEEEENSFPAEERDETVMNAGDNNLLALTNFVNDNNGRRDDTSNIRERSYEEEINMEITHHLNGDHNSNNRCDLNEEDLVDVDQENTERAVNLMGLETIEVLSPNVSRDWGSANNSQREVVPLGLYNKPNNKGTEEIDKKIGAANQTRPVKGMKGLKTVKTLPIQGKQVALPAIHKEGTRKQSSNLKTNTATAVHNKGEGNRISVVAPSKSASSSSEGRSKDGCVRNPIGRFKAPKGNDNSVSSAGSILCCSSLNSSDIRNCNKQILNKAEISMVDKVWKGVVELGVEGEEVETVYRNRISVNEKRDSEARILREQNKQVKL
ncbi:hypothetical protein L195_g020424 [Trifolium pratense]|uniref:Uncharacterized protein n=1 Tax=Trifolium pratense TaxID=57577 RepID=A0A2K3N2I2_TRIPR|nr:hypothetical protein L195_g020424 [Trifolium pratense]